MTKKARRRQIMEVVGYTDRRVEYIGDTDNFTYKRDGELLKEELKKVLEHLDAWHSPYEHHTKYAWRKHIRDTVGIEYGHPDETGYEKFSLHDLTMIWREVKE